MQLFIELFLNYIFIRESLMLMLIYFGNTNYCCYLIYTHLKTENTL